MRILTYVSLFVAVTTASWMLLLSESKVGTSSPTLQQQAVASLLEAQEVTTTTAFFMTDTLTYTLPSGRKDTLDVRLPNCDDIFIIESDEIALGPVYKDQIDSSRNNVMTVCPPTNGRRLLLTFAEFDLSVGDTLYVYDGHDTLAPLIDKASSTGVSQVNGGWLNSNCDPSLNPSGCITLQFKTNGDTKAGTGWSGFVSCLQDSTTTFDKTDNIFAQADCNTLLGTADIKVPTIKFGQQGVCTVSNDSVIVEYFLNDLDTVFCKSRDTLRMDSIKRVTLPYGIYDVKFSLLKDTTITAGCFLTISTPSFVCNDTIVAAIGQGCKSFLRPDDLLENFGNCAPFENDSIKQFFVLHVETDTGRVSGTSTHPPLLNAKEGGNVVCNGLYDVYVTRVIEVKNLDCSLGRADSIQYRDSCKVTVNLVDGIKPVFVNILNDTLTKIDTFVGCQDIQITADHLVQPAIFDNCELDTLIATVPDIELQACDTNKFFYVKWIASDQCGNTSEAIQKLLIRRPTAENLYAPKDTMISCGVDPFPENTGWPHLDTNDDGIPDIQLITDGGETCFLDVFYRDDTIPNCGKAIKIVRYWSLRNFCENEQSVTPADTQLIEILDTIAPIIFKPAPGVIGSHENPYIFPTSHTACKGIPGTIPIPGGIDSCDLNYKTEVVALYYPSSRAEYFPDLDQELPLGTYSVGYTHVDACGNRSDTCRIFFEIKDQQAPTPICTDELRVSMTTGNFPIRPQDIDNGSRDNCGIDKMFIRRSVPGDITVMDPTTNEFILREYGGRIPSNGWNEYIEVGCLDINQTVRVQLLVIDEVGNYNQCWLNIFPEDHLQPLCSELPDTVLFNDAFLTTDFGEQTDHNHNNIYDDHEWLPVPVDKVDLFNTHFGNPICTDNVSCNTIFIEQEYQLIIDICGVLRIRRRYRAVDYVEVGNFSKWLEQDILITYRADWEITFPSDTLFQCGSAVPEFPIMVTTGGPDVLKWEYKDELFAGTGGGCYKVFRKWQVINSCLLNDNAQPLALPRDAGVNGHVPYDGRRTFSSKDTLYGVALGDLGYLTYTQVIKVTDNQAPIVSVSVDNNCVIGGQTCTEAKVFNITAQDCTFSEDITFKYKLYEDNFLVAEGTGADIGYNVSAFSTYIVKVEAYDNCGNSSVHEQLLAFRDCDPPVAFCNGGNLNIDITANRRAEVPALWLDNKSFDNCDKDLSYHIWHPTVSDILPVSYETIRLLPNAISLGCGDQGQSTVVLFIIDDHQNFSSCSTNITIQDALGNCVGGRAGKIVGQIATEEGTMVEGVAVRLAEDNTAVENSNEHMQMTGINGDFSFDATVGKDFTITPTKNVNVKNGVSTYDIVMIQKHILGITSLESPYRYIAADVNKSGTITAYDIVQMRQVILEILPNFPNNESWRFVNASYPMDAINPLTSFEETYQTQNLQGTEEADFIAVKVGDVSGNATPNEFQSAEPRSQEAAYELQVENIVLKAGQRYKIAIQPTAEALLGLQFTLSYDQLTLIDWQSPILQAEHIAQGKSDQLMVSWNVPQPNPKVLQQPLLTLEVEAQKDGYLKEFLKMPSRPLVAEAYQEAGVTDIALVFEGNTTTSTFEVYQNKPNPFSLSTQIGFYLPTPSPVHLTIRDVTGRIVYQESGDYGAGAHQITVDRAQLSYKGLLYYEVASSIGKATKTMLLIH